MSESNSTASALVVIQLQTYLNCIEVPVGSWTRLEGSKCTSDLYWNSNVSYSFVTGKYIGSCRYVRSEVWQDLLILQRVWFANIQGNYASWILNTVWIGLLIFESLEVPVLRGNHFINWLLLTE